MDQTQELIAIVKDKNTSNEKLNELLQMANDQLDRYNKVNKLISNPGPWTYDLHQKALNIGSGGRSGSITRSEFELLQTTNKSENLRNDIKYNIETGIVMFNKIRDEINIELSKRNSNKPKWKFWK